MVLYQDMHEDQGDASHINRAYAYANGTLYMYGPLALEIATTNEDNQEVPELTKVTATWPYHQVIYYEPGTVTNRKGLTPHENL